MATRSPRATRSSCGTSRSNRDESVYEDPDVFDIHRNPEHQAFGAGGRHFCLGTALARLELKVLFEETLKRYPNMTRNGEAKPAIDGLPQSVQDAAGQARVADGRSPSSARASVPRPHSR